MTHCAGEVQEQQAADTQVVLRREVQHELDRLQSEAEGRAENVKRRSQEAKTSTGEGLLSRTRSWTDVEDESDEDIAVIRKIQQGDVQPQPLENEQSEDVMTSHVADIDSGDEPIGSLLASSTKTPTSKTKRHGWLPYDAAQKGNRKADRRQADDRRITRVGFTDVEFDPNKGPGLDRLREVAEVHEVHGSDQPQEKSVTYVDSNVAVPTQTAAPVERLEVRGEEPTDTQARREAAANSPALLHTESDSGHLTEQPVGEQAGDLFEQNPPAASHPDMDEEEGRSPKMPPSKITALGKNKDQR